MPVNRIKGIGLELEGGWVPRANLPEIRHDGSVQGIPNDRYNVGEISSAPLSTIEAAEAWLRENYPQTVHPSCGFHVHVSLPPLHYSRLMNESFNGCFLNAMEDFWTRFRSEPGFDLFRSRLDGQNQYCQKNFRPEHQLWRMEHYGDHRTLPRYSQLNFCYGRHGTMECRMFPCFPQVGHAVEATKTFINCINSYLATCPPEKPIVVKVEAEDAEHAARPVLTTA